MDKWLAVFSAIHDITMNLLVHIVIDFYNMNFTDNRMKPMIEPSVELCVI